MSTDNSAPSSASSSMSRSVDRALSSLAIRCARRPAVAITIAAVLTAVSVYCATQLRLSADLVELLPETFESVQELDRLSESFGGAGYVVVVARDADPDRLTALADGLGPKLESLESVRFVDYKRSREYFEERGLFFLDVEDLELVRQRVEAREAWERKHQNPMYIDLEGEDPPSLEFPEIQAKMSLGNTAMRSNQATELYYLDREQRMLALFAKPSGISTDLNFAKKVVGDVKAATKEFVTGNFDDVEIIYAGTYTKKVDQQQLISSDLKVSTLVAVILVLLYLGFHFRGLAGVLFLFLPLASGLMYTYAFAWMFFGVLNILTGFIGAILLGLGIDHGIHLLDRFNAEMQGKRSLEDALRETFGGTGRAVMIAGLTTVVGFGGLGFSEFRAFGEFGVIAAAGTVGVVLSYLTLLPALLAVAHSRGWTPDAGKSIEPGWYARWLPQRAGAIAVVALVVAAFGIYNIRNADFNYDTRSLSESNLESFQWDFALDGLLGYSMTPVIVLTRTQAEEDEVAGALRARQKERGAKSSIDIVMARGDLVPDNQAAKVPVIREIGEILKRVKPKMVARKNRKALKKMKIAASADPFTYADLPVQVRRLFEGPGGKSEESFVLIFSNLDLSDGYNAVTFANEVRHVPVGDTGRTTSAVGEAMVMADVYDLVARESGPVLLFTLMAIFITMALLIGSLPLALVCLLPALFTLGVTMGVLPLADMEFNTINIVMIPVLFGVGVDGGVHLVLRLRSEESIPHVLEETGRAIAAALLTTSLGFGALMLADHTGLRSLGSLALMGLGMNLIACLTALPALLAWWRNRAEPSAAPVQST